MVSIRRRKLIGDCYGRSLPLAPVPSVPDGNVAEEPEQDSKPVDVRREPSVALNQLVEVKQEKDILPRPAKKLKIAVQIHPESPLEVHSYLMQLKKENKLELGPLQRSEEIPVKEWMEMCYPQIFGVFPQDPKLLSQCPDKAKQSELLYCHYCLFLFEVRNIVFMDCRVSPDYVESLGNVIKILEKQGFDCRFMRSELVVVGYLMRKQKDIMLAEKQMIATRSFNIEKRLRAAATKVKEAELDEQENQTEGMALEIGKLEKEPNKLPGDPHKRELNLLPCDALQKECIESVLDSHKKMLARKEEDWLRLSRVLEKIGELHRGRAVFPGR